MEEARRSAEAGRKLSWIRRSGQRQVLMGRAWGPLWLE